MFSLRMHIRGRTTSTTSCAIAEAEFAYASALMSIHFPSTSWFQNTRIGVQENMVSRKMTKVLTTIQVKMA